MRRHHEAAEPEIGRAAAVQRLESPSAYDRLSQLQGTAGNAAVAAMFSGPQVVQRLSPTMTLGGWLGKSAPTDRYTIKIKALNDDAIGHAWITVTSLQDPTKSIAVGFWPDDWYSGIIGPGKLLMPDPHESEEDHVESDEMDQEHFRLMLNVVNSYERMPYGLLLNNCVDFARRAWNAGTDRDFSPIWEAVTWHPALLGQTIEDDNKARGRDKMDRPPPQ